MSRWELLIVRAMVVGIPSSFVALLCERSGVTDGVIYTVSNVLTFGSLSVIALIMFGFVVRGVPAIWRGE